MSVVLPILVDTAPPEQVALDALVAPFFETDRPLRGPAARVDWRLCGLLSLRLTEARIAGRAGEAVLLPGGGRLRAPRVVLIGLGPRPGFSEGTLRRIAREAMDRMVQLQAPAIGVALPPESVHGLAVRAGVRAWVSGAAAALAERPMAASLRLLVAADEEPSARAGVADAIAGHAGSVVLRSVREERLPEGRRAAEAPADTPAETPAGTSAAAVRAP